MSTENKASGTFEVFKEKPELHISELTGRRRRLSDGVMLKICDLFENGERTQEIADMFGISLHTVYSICYWTPRKVQPERKPRNAE